ncbi:S9 family peptidase [Maricaulis sp.]|uniref:S9 family peptidase n=1 Tax=Maricaulis sp. TaxID=1486257 RepID=UPI00263986FD|nr:S9 family peptidase [Maricaulis sp.]
MYRSILQGASALVAGCAIAAPGFAQDALTLEDLFEIRQVGAIALAPDGDDVAFTVSVPRNVVDGDADGTPDVELHIASGADEARAYITGEGRVSGIEWRPDGEAVTFLTRRDGDSHTALYEIPVAGGEARRILSHDSSIQSYVIAPDNETVFFIARDEVDPTERTLRERGFRANVYEENGEFAHVWRARLGDDAADAEMLDLPGHASSLVISEDGSRLGVVLAPTALVDDSLMERRWHVVDATSGALVSTIDTPGKIGGAAFSPDASQLAFLAAADRADPVAGTLHVADAASGAYRAIARGAEQHVSQVAWRDSNTIIALASIGTGTALVDYNVDGREERRSAHEGLIVASMDYDRDDRELAVVAHAPDHPRELFVADRRNLERWTDHNPQLADIAWGDQRAYSFEARDGERIEGVLVTPQGEAPVGGWPLIMTVHGGPEAHDQNGWVNGYSRFGHIAAGEGMAVFYPNYRGSTGRGERFAKLDHADAPGEEFWDLVDAINALSRDGIVDADRVGITGGSYGGFASSWGATIASEHFAAAAPFVALTDLISFYGTTEIPVEMVDVHFMEPPWTDWTAYLENSPTYHAPGSTTPTLILHGEADTRVDTSQSFILYRILKMTSQAPVRLVTYPGEGHGNRMAAAQYDYGLRVMRWMQHYLQGEGGEPPAADLGLADRLGLDED